ncbi:MAG: DNA polymerase domain-containing protein, partial [Candidatus Bathyarchaeia archaeon]
GPGEMTVWIIAENGERVRLRDKFQPKIYVSGRMADLSKLTDQLATSESVAGWRYVEKCADFMEDKRSRVLEITATDCRRIPYFARKLLRLGGYQRFRLHNVDVPDAQMYLYDRDIFPLAFVGVTVQGDRLAYWLLDSVESVDYKVPPFRLMSMRVEVAAKGTIPSFNDPIKSVILEMDGKRIVIDEGDESEKILEMVEAIKEEDPDVIFTRGGDSFLFPYLAHRALVNGVLHRLVLGREDVPLKAKKKRGITFFSYGRVYFKAPMRRLYGRIHVDEENTFIYSACGLDGLIEVSRTCRVPLHRAARASIGTIMSSLQLYQAVKDGILIPWKKREPEAFKSAWELLVADRGGFIFEPKLGIHDGVAEVDFSSMYPTLMAKRNISAETVLCKCCPNSRVRVPELGYNLCEKREGIVPRTLKMILKKRTTYKRLRREAEDPKLRQVFDRRQNALKWILVTCFGYLGYKNARFGKVDAHIAVCAFAREALLRTVRMAEEKGFEIVHGIVDSLWLKKEGASPREYVELCKAVSKEIGVQLNVEGRYRWIVFLPSRMHVEVPVLNRYFGVFESGKIKVRGIEAVRRDTPPFIRSAQIDMIKVLAKASNSEAFMKKISESEEILRDYVEKVRRRDVDVQDLIISKQLSMHPDKYAHDVFHAIAAKQLMREGIEVSAGQTIRYLITDAENKRPNSRVKVAGLVSGDTRFDTEKYVDMLILAATNILSPFGYTEEGLKDKVYYGEKQAVLNPTLTIR